jgi:hypothetical protein
MVNYIISVEAKDDYTLLVTFENGEKKLCDISDLLDKPMYKPLKNRAFFCTVKVGFGTAIWNDNIDIAPEYLYENGVKI